MSTYVECPWCRSVGRCDCKDRAECSRAGQPGHAQCGMCFEHEQPRFVCGCLLLGDKAVSRDEEGKEP